MSLSSSSAADGLRECSLLFPRTEDRCEILSVSPSEVLFSSRERFFPLTEERGDVLSGSSSGNLGSLRERLVAVTKEGASCGPRCVPCFERTGRLPLPMLPGAKPDRRREGREWWGGAGGGNGLDSTFQVRSSKWEREIELTKVVGSHDHDSH